jgi:hypothetical protein
LKLNKKNKRRENLLHSFYSKGASRSKATHSLPPG